MDDWRLLRQYAEQNSQEAFAALTRRYLNLVYSVCRRELGDADLAEDVTQAVFLILARKASSLRRGVILSGWLFQTARFAAQNAWTREQRRRRHEQEAAQAMSSEQTHSENSLWDSLEPVLNPALAKLGTVDRDAVLLRCLEGRSLAETGQALGVSEDAAEKRVARALDKLRRILTKEGVIISGVALVALLPARAVQSAPAQCVPAVAQATLGVLAGQVNASLAGSHAYKLSQGVLHAMKIAKMKMVAGAVALALTGTAITYTVVRGDAGTTKKSGTIGRPVPVSSSAPSATLIPAPSATLIPAPSATLTPAQSTTLTPAQSTTLTLGRERQGKAARPVRSYQGASPVTSTRGQEGHSPATTQPATTQIVGPRKIRAVGKPSSKMASARMFQMAMARRGGTGTVLRADAKTPARPVPAAPPAQAAPPVPAAAALPGAAVTPGAAVEGRVTSGPDAQPMPGVRVGAQQIGIGNGNGSAITDSQGRYHMVQLSPGRYNLALDLAGEAGGLKLDRDWTARAHENVALVAGQSLKDINFALVRGGIISGQVVGQQTGKPVGGLMIGLYGPAHPRTTGWVQAATTDSDGRFTLRVPDGDQYLYLMGPPPPGFLKPTAPPTGSVPISHSHSTEFSNEGYDLSVKDGQTVAVKWLLPEAAPVKPVMGRVLNAQGQPVANADVLYAPQGENGGFEGTAQTDAQGRFTITPTSSLPLLLRARQGDRATPKATLLASGGDIALSLQDHALVGLKGRVVDSSGKPLPDAKVNLITWRYAMGLGGDTVSTDAEGRYVFSSLWPDARYSVDASLEGYGDAQSSLTPVKPGDNRELPALTLARADSFVAGQVVDAQGTPLPAVTVGVSGPHASYKNAVTDADGHFRIDGLVASDALYLWAALDVRRADKRGVRAGTSDVVLIVQEEKKAQKPAP